MEGSRLRSAPWGRAGAAPRGAATGGAAEDLLEACRGAVSRVLAELPERDRRVVEGHQAEVVAATHRETLAAIEEIVGSMERVA